MARERKIETRFAYRASTGKGIGIDEAAAAAQARIEKFLEEAVPRFNELLVSMQAAAPAIAEGEPEAMRFVNRQADAIVGLSNFFGLPEVGKAAFSLCQLFDLYVPDRPTSEGVRVHLDALTLLWSAAPGARALAAPQVLEGLRQVVVTAQALKM